MNYKKLVQETIEQINKSEDCMYTISANLFLGVHRLYFKLEENKKFNHFYDFSTWSDMYIYLKGFQKGANSLKPF